MADDDPGRIEVQLSILSGQESAAFKEIQQTAKQVSEMMQMFKSRDFVEAAERLQKVHDAMVQSTTQMSQVSKQLQEQERTGGVRGVLGGIASKVGQKISGVSEQKTHEKLAEQQKMEQERREETRQTVRQQQLEGMTDQERSAQHRRERYSGRIPDLWENQDPNAFYNKIPTLNPDAAGIRIPQYGELTIQDILGRLRDNRLRASQQAGSDADFQRYGNQAERIERISQMAGNVAGGQAIFRQLRRHVSAPIQGFIGNFDETPAMGFRRDTNPFSDILGIQTPFSAYGGESARQMRDTMLMRFSAGINGQQASQITAASLAAGFTGQQGTDVRRALLEPAVRNFGIDPNSLIPFTQTLRTGTANIQDLNLVISQLGEGARSARMGIDEFAQSITQSGEQAQQSGGTFLQGTTFGTQFSNATGLNPQVGSQLLQNRVVQGYLAANTGLPGRLAGAASPLAQQQSIEQALRDRVSAYSGTMPSSRTPIHDATGKVVGYETTSGNDAAVGAAAQDLGIDQEQARAILNRKGGDSVANFSALSRLYLRNVTGKQSPGDISTLGRQFAQKETHRRAFAYDTERRYNTETGMIETRHGLLRGWHNDDDETNKFRQQVYGNRASQFQTSGQGSLRQLHEMAMAAGVSQADWRNQVDKHANDPWTQIQNAQKLVSERSVDVNSDASAIKFTGPAAKFFEALVSKNKNLAGASDLSRAAVATSSAGPSPLSNQTNSAGSFGGLNSIGP